MLQLGIFVHYVQRFLVKMSQCPIYCFCQHLPGCTDFGQVFHPQQQSGRLRANCLLCLALAVIGEEVISRGAVGYLAGAWLPMRSVIN
ncbi:MAG TPA: hypothetical protein PLK31_00730 [Chloroflexota bacterium]|nr:hypothetical protein [Chloroflexota bacterium]